VLEKKWGRPRQKSDESELLLKLDEVKQQLYAIAYSYMRNEPDALEAVQETVCRIWAKRHTLREPNYFKTWATRILIRVCLDEQKKKTRGHYVYEATIVLQEEGGQENAAQRLDLADLIQTLPANYRMVIALKYYRDMTITDIAELLEKPDGTIRTWLNKALKLLRSDMTEQRKEEREHEYRAEAGAGRTGADTARR
jgi:RNA polymerase sigma factor (sigma-70 family)